MPSPKPRAWSYSALTQWEGCHFQYKLEKIDKIKVPMGAPLVRGIRVHEEAEGYLKHETAELPQSLTLLRSHYEALRKVRGLMIEEAYAFTAKWERCGWMAPDVWLRVKVDYAYKPRPTLIKIGDHKTGKMRDSQKPQLRLYALTGLLVDAKAKEAASELAYVDQGQVVPGPTLTRADVAAERQA